MFSQLLGRKRSFYRQLLTSYLKIAIVAAIFCIFLLFLIFLLTENTYDLTHLEVPRATAVYKIKNQISLSNTNLRNWIIFGEKQYQIERRRIWQQLFNEFESIASIQTDDSKFHQLLIELRIKLADLYEWQWRIEDIAYSQGNEPAKLLWQRDALPILNQITQTLHYFVQATAIQNKQQNILLFNQLLATKQLFITIQHDLTDHLFTNKNNSFSAIDANIDSAQIRFQQISLLIQQSTQEDQYLWSQVDSEFNALIYIIDEIHHIYDDQKSNLAQRWIRQHIQPIELVINELLQEVDLKNGEMLVEKSTEAEKLGSRAIFISILLPITMFSLIYFLAKRNSQGLSYSMMALSKTANDIARGRLNSAINIGGTLELDALAQAFKRTQTTLKDSYGRLQALVDTALDAIIMINTQGKIEMFNKAAENMFGYSTDDVLGQPIGILMNDKDAEQHGDYIEEYLRTGKGRLIGISRELTAKSQSGEIFPIHISVSEMKLSNYHGFTGIIRDISHQKKQMDQLVEAEKMSALGLMVAGVAHEVNTPLGNAITANSFQVEQLRSLNTSLLEDKLSRKELNDYIIKTNDILEIVNSNLQRAAEIISHFKNVAVDQSSGERRRINLHTYLEEVLHTLYPRYKHTDIDVSLDCPSEITIHTYPGALFQIISNLVVNSIIHGFKENKEGYIKLSVQHDNQSYTINYHDNGVGIDPTIADHIFEPFITTRRDEGGSGLGMHIVYNLVTQKLSGKINLLAKEERGIYFQLNFPKKIFKS